MLPYSRRREREDSDLRSGTPAGFAPSQRVSRYPHRPAAKVSTSARVVQGHVCFAPPILCSTGPVILTLQYALPGGAPHPLSLDARPGGTWLQPAANGAHAQPRRHSMEFCFTWATPRLLIRRGSYALLMGCIWCVSFSMRRERWTTEKLQACR